MKDITATINKLWSNKQTHALMVLGIYVLLILIFFVIYIVAIKLTPLVPISKADKTIKEITVEDIQKTLLNNNYEYYYQIETIDGLVTYKGTKTSTNEEGYKETALGSTRYYIEEGLIYEIRLNELFPLVDLYTGVDYYLINLPDLFKLIDRVEPKVNIKEKKTYEYNIIYNDEPLIMTISFKDLTSATINIVNDNYHYTLEYSKIREVDEPDSSQYKLSNQS